MPVRPSARPRRRPLVLAFRGLAVACAGVLVAGLGWLAARSGGGADDTMSGGSSKADSGSAESLSAAGYLSCSRLVVEGTVTAVEPVAGTAQRRVTLHVTRSYKPEKPEKDGAEVSFVWEDFLDPRPSKGQHVLVGIPHDSAVPDKWVVGRQEIADERAWITRALPESRTLTCE